MDTDELDQQERQHTLPCPFAKTLLAIRARCSLAHKYLIAEREGLQCTQLQAHLRCQTLLQRAGEQAQFTFSRRDPQQPYTHRQQLRLQAAILGTLAREIHADADFSQRDIHTLLDAALARFGILETLPFTQIIRTLAK